MGTATNFGAGAARLIGPAAMLLAIAAACPALAVTKAKPVATRHLPGATVTLDSDGTAEHLRANGLSSFAPDVVDSGKFSFTAPGSTPANARLATTERAFRFTPSGKVDNRRAFSIGVTSRVVAAAADTSRAAAVPVEVAQANPVPPAAYNVDLAVGWRSFAVSGGFGRSETAATLPSALALSLPPRRDALDAGVSYRGASWKTSLQVAAEEGPPLLLSPLAPPSPSLLERRYSVEVGGAYLLTPQLSVTGGVKYKTTLSPTDPLRRDQGVYLGTAFTF
jgi:hypothetical protein